MTRIAPKIKATVAAKNRIRVFLVDDHPVFREGLSGLLNREGDFVICGEADSAPNALTAIENTTPDLVLLDISLPGKSGLELIKDLSTACPDVALLVISMHDESLYAERVLRAGGAGYVMKQEGPDRILQAIRQVLSGQVFVSQRISASILGGLSRRARNSSPISQLTNREFEILQLIGRGRDSHAIAKHLNLSVKTVDAHRGHIKEKLKLKSGTELICYAVRWAESARSIRA